MEDFQDVLSFMRGKVLLEMSFSPFKDDLARKKLCNEHIRVIYFLIIYVYVFTYISICLPRPHTPSFIILFSKLLAVTLLSRTSFTVKKRLQIIVSIDSKKVGLTNCTCPTRRFRLEKAPS